MSRRRPVTAHALKRRLIAKLEGVGEYECERILRDLREYVIARRFHGGASVDTIARNQTIGNAEWTTQRIEQALRNRSKIRCTRP